jgi:hypothetical protein
MFSWRRPWYYFFSHPLVLGTQQCLDTPGDTSSRGALETNANAIPGEVILVTVDDGVIILPPGIESAGFSDATIVEPHLRGMLVGLGTYEISRMPAPVSSSVVDYLRRIFLIRHARSHDNPDSVVQRLRTSSVLESVSSNVRVSSRWTERWNYDDPNFADNDGQFNLLLLGEAHALVRGNRSRWIAIVDDGVAEVADLEPNRLNKPNDVGTFESAWSTGHGANLAGICCARDNQIGIVGTAPRAGFAAYGGSGDVFTNLAAGTLAVDDGAGIILAAWGHLTNDIALYSAAKVIVDGWTSAGTVVVAAVGNSVDEDCSKSYSIPDSVPGVIAVGHTTEGCDVEWVDVLGSHAWNTYDSDGTLVVATGTSTSAAAVAGIANLLMTLNANITRAQVKTVLENSAFATGRVNAQGALQYAEKHIGTGRLDVPVFRTAEENGLTEINWTVVEGSTRTVPLHIQNIGTGALHYTGFAFGVTWEWLIPVPNAHIRFRGPRALSSHGYIVENEQLEISKGYLAPYNQAPHANYRSSRNIEIEIDATNHVAGDEIVGLLGFNVPAGHGDVLANDASGYTWLVKVTVVEPSVDDICITSRFLRNTHLEPEIETLRSFRDEVMKTKTSHGRDWAALYRENGSKVLEAMHRDFVQVPAFRKQVEKYLPAVKAKLAHEIGLGFFVSTEPLERVIRADDLEEGRTLVQKLLEANPDWSSAANKLLAISEHLLGKTVGEAMDLMLATHPDSLTSLE